MRIGKFFLFFVSFCLLWSAQAFGSENVKRTENTSVEIFSNGERDVIVHFQIEKGWHIYWENPGEIGEATEISANSDIKIINQSIPLIRNMYEMMDEYMYENDAYYHIYVTDPKNTILTVSYVECNDICRQEEVKFDLSQLSPVSEKEWETIKKRAEKSFPEKMKVVSPLEQNVIEIDENVDPFGVRFIAAEKDIIDPNSIKISGQNKKIEIRWDTNDDLKLHQALLVLPDKFVLLDIVYSNISDFSLFYVLILAFIGGVILNAMPCVFPILSLKIFGLMKKKSYHHRIRHAIQYILGVVFCFLILAVFLVVLKNQGKAIGWGFQLQSPIFVGVMAVVFFALFMFMMEWFKFPSLTNRFIYKTAGLNAFTTGFFAVLIASPCTGPFMGAAVGYAFMNSTKAIIAIFMALALGYALPYALIEIFPQAIRRIMPRPGKWMRFIKIILAIPLLITSLWLVSVFISQIGIKQDQTEENSVEWSVYDPEEIENLNQAEKNIFIDFTADWCLTCQFNERIVFKSQAFKKFVRENNIYLFKADLTTDNVIYRDALNFYGREGIPLYVYYYHGKHEILPTFFRLSDLVKE